MNLNTEEYFSTVPEIHCPRSVFDRSFTYKTTMNTDYLYPIFVDEALPGDSFRLRFQVFGRLLNPLVVPIMDELYFETLWFKIPNRLVWSHWVNFNGEQDNPNDSTDYVLPTVDIATNLNGSNLIGTLVDYFGLPVTLDALSNGPCNVNALPFRAYNLVYNQWFRDQNLINSVTVPLGDSDSISNYSLLKSAKMHDYFTSCLPFAQKGDQVMLPLGDYAPVVGDGKTLGLYTDTTHLFGMAEDNNSLPKFYSQAYGTSVGTTINTDYGAASNLKSIGVTTDATKSGLRADLTKAVGASISDFRFAMKLQRKREIDAVSGTRYIEYIKAHFSVDSPDARLQRTEFLGSTREMIDINSVIQTSSSDSTSPQGHITAYGVINNHESGFSTSFTEHCYVLGIARIRHNPIYQQGINKMWKRSALLDFYLPVFNGISEQPVYNYELYAQGDAVLSSNGNKVDDEAFGFQEAWAEYRYKPSMVTGMLRSGVSGSLDAFHLAQNFSQLPLLNQSFIEESIPLSRALSITPSATIPEFIMDFRFIYECARPMPVRNIPSDLETHF